MEAMRKWLRQQLLDADEETRTWRLRAIQAEAELRALQVDVPGSPKMESLDSESGDTGGAGSEQAASLNKPQDWQVILSQVLGLEKHLEEWEPWRTKLSEETQVARAEAQKLQVLLEAQKAELPRAEREAKEASQEAKGLQEERAKVKAAHDARCSMVAKEIHELLVNAGVRKVGESLVSLQQGESALQTIQTSTRQLEDDVKETAQKREELCMRLEELKTRHLNNMETRTKSARDVQGARQALQARQSTLTKLQAEVSRTRARSERKKKQLEAQLAQSLLELKDAKARMDSADEALRKVRHQHSKQLRSVKSQTSSLQAEVDAHIQASEAAEQEMQQLRERESQLESSEQHFLQQEEDLRLQAMRAKERLSSLEQQTERFEDERRTLIEELQPLEEEWEQVELQAKALQDLADADALKAKEHQAAAAGCKEEIGAHLREFASQADELTMLSSLEADVADLRKRRDQLVSERTALEDASKASLHSLDQQLSDLREAHRRSAQLKAAHEEFVKLLPPSSLRQVAMSVAAEQSLLRISRKADQLHSYFEGPGRPPGTGPPSARRTRVSTSGKETSASSSGPSGRLAEQLMEAAETIVKDELKESRQTLVDLQQKLADGSNKRSQEIFNLRSERRQLEEDLCRVEATVHSATTSSAALVEELERHLKELQKEAKKDEATLTAEFSDVLQQQAIERDELKSQVEELRSAEAEEAAKSEIAAAALLDREEARKRLKDLEIELSRLQAEEEEVVEAHVSLKAALMGRRAHSVPRSAALRGHHDVRPRPLSLPADRTSKASTPGSEEPPRQRSGAAAQAAPAQPAVTPTPTAASPSQASNPGTSPTLRSVQMLRAHSQGQLLMTTTSRRSGYSGSDASSRVQAASPDTSPRMVRGAPLTASLPALAHVGHRISPTQTVYARHTPVTTSMTMAPRQWNSVDKLVYTWPRQCQTPGPGTLVTLAAASAVSTRTMGSEFRTL